MNKESETWLAEVTQFAEAEYHYYSEATQAAAAWKAKWARHCTNCEGWGMLFSPGQYSGLPEQCYPADSDSCEALPEGSCHRCGQPKALISNIMDCQFCGWNYNDGAPQI